MGVGHLAAALNDFDYHLQDDMAALASQINTTATADTLEGLSAEHWASAVQEATRLPPFRNGTHAAEVAASRWFKNDEVHDLLVNGLACHGFRVQTSLACKPGSGSLLGRRLGGPGGRGRARSGTAPSCRVGGCRW